MKEVNNLGSYYFHQGTSTEAYNYLGCNMSVTEGQYVYTFRTWAPSADSVSVVSDFTDWDIGMPMYPVTEKGVWELIFRSSTPLERKAYKFRITSGDKVFIKGDPYSRFSKGLDDGASLVFTSSDFKWTDSRWMLHRSRTVTTKRGKYIPSPILIYEAHLGSIARHDDGSLCSYREIADFLSTYLRRMGYTHVELLPIMEHPYDGSWGYQVGAFYAPTSRFGDPDDFRYFVNKLHSAGIGVILDWVPAHFPKDAWGLYEFDGGPLYEYQGRDRMESRSWGTRFFDVGREEVQSFLISNALYYLREFHVDGLRVDAVASMLYLDYDRSPGEWIPNVDGGNLNLESVAFFKKLNSAIFKEFPSVLMIAEESTAYGNVTKPVAEGGLGFNLKWNMGWANDFYKYISTDPLYRKNEHKALNFPIMYAFNENYCLPISHDEVVHGKKSFLDKMFGSYEDKFSQFRTALLYMMTFPGKKLMFMGTEYAPFREWDYDDSLEWFMLDYPAHSIARDYTCSVNNFYLSRSELWEDDFTAEGFEWLLADEAEKNLIAFRRINSKGESVVVVISFSGATQNIRLKLKRSRMLERLFESSIGLYPDSVKVEEDDREYYADLAVPPFSGVVFKEKLYYKSFKS